MVRSVSAVSLIAAERRVGVAVPSSQNGERSRFEGRRRGGQRMKRLEHQAERLTKDAQTLFSHAVRCLRQAQSTPRTEQFPCSARFRGLVRTYLPATCDDPLGLIGKPESAART